MNNPATPGQPEYLQAWSLRCHPFEEKLDMQFFYAGSALMQRLDLLTHLVQFSESIVVVSGPRGSGKTTLLEQFLGHINPQWIVCRMDGAQGNKLAEQLAESIGLQADEDEQALLARWVAQCDPAQQLILVIDNAEQLDDSALQRICELTAVADGDRLRVVLFGTAETQDRVRAMLEQLGSKRSCQTLELPKLTEEETAAYLMYRLAVAGYSGESPFTPTEVRAICKSARGRPGQINRLAHESLVEHHMRAKINRRAPVRRGPKKNAAPLWIGASVVIAILAGYLGWQRLVSTEAPDDEAPVPAEQAIIEQPLVLPPDTIDKGDVSRSEPSPPPEPLTGPVKMDSVEPPSGQPAVTANATAPEQTDKPDTPLANAVTKKPAPAVIATPPDTTPTANRAISEPEESTPGNNAVGIKAPAQSKASQTPPVSSEPATTAQGDAEPPHRESWLLQQPPTRFTLQLLGSRDQSSIAKYIKRHGLAPDQTAYYRGRYRGGDWYVLLYGIYPDKAAALVAATEAS
jgi:DamX protein